MISPEVGQAMEEPLWLPRPRRWRREPGTYRMVSGQVVRLTPAAPLRSLAMRWTGRTEARAGVHLEVVAATSAPAARVALEVALDGSAALGEEGYTLRIGEEGIRVQAHAAAGARHALATLGQLVTQYGPELPRLDVEDAPALPARGVMLDVSRTRVPTMATLYRLVDRLADLKINHLQLYMEHTFAYAAHRAVWAEASPFTGAEILALDAYCRERGIELVPNQNSFGHLTPWLRLPAYRHLAECPEGSEFPWGRIPEPFSLAPGPESLRFLEGLYDELLPHFTSPRFNVGFDETYDLGQGKSRQQVEALGRGVVLRQFLTEVDALVRARGRTTLFWADMVTTHHPEEIPHLPPGAVALEWGYAADHPFLERARPLAEAGRPFYVCPGTSSWLSFTGRHPSAVANLTAAAGAAQSLGAQGYLITDWGDLGHWQPLPVSYPAFAFGASAAWNPAALPEPAHLAAAVGLHLFGDRTGQMGEWAVAYGSLHAKAGGDRAPGSEGPALGLALLRPAQWPAVLAAVGSADLVALAEETLEWDRRIARAPMEDPEADLVRAEFAHAGAAIRLACDLVRRLRGDGAAPGEAELAGCLEELSEEHRRLWLRRSRPGGLSQSLAFLNPLRQRLAEGL